jgi:hypothetical protein
MRLLDVRAAQPFAAKGINRTDSLCERALRTVTTPYDAFSNQPLMTG